MAIQDEELAKLVPALRESLRGVLQSCLEGTEADLKTYADEILRDALRIANGKAPADAATHLQAQALLLAERMKLRFRKKAMHWFVTALSAVLDTALRVAAVYLREKGGSL